MIEQTPKNSQEQTPPEVISVTPKKSPLPVILLGILGLLVVAGAVYAGFKMGKKQILPNITAEPTIIPQTTEVSSTPDPTENWKTYTNTKFNYSLKYPADWNLVIKGNLDPQTAEGPNFIAPCNFEGGDNCPFFQVDSNSAAYNQQNTLEDYFVYNPETTKILSKLPLVIDGEKALTMETFVNNWSEGMVNLDTKMIHNKTLFAFSYREENKNQSQIKTSADFKSKQVFDQILSTFKFTDTSTTSETGKTIPADLAALIKSDAINNSPEKLTPDQIKLGTPRIIGNFAQIPVNVCTEKDSCPGHIIWAAKVNSVWKIVTGGQDAPSCTILSEYNFPKDFECNP